MADRDKITLTRAELKIMIAEAVTDQIAEMQKVKHEVTQDQHDMLSIIAPTKVARHNYSIVETEDVNA